MTSIAFIMGVLPLVTSTGAGAEMRQVLGTAVLVGMLGVTFFGLFLTPVFYVVLRGLTARLRRAAPLGAAGHASTLVLLLSFVALASGCMLAGRHYRPPTPPAVARFENARIDAPETVEAAWWLAFGDPTLTGLVERAAAENQDLRVAAARLREARALRAESRFDLLPTVTASGGYTRTRATKDATLGAGGRGGSEGDRELDLVDAGFDASWELDLFGRVRRSIEARTADVQAAESALHDALVVVQAEVARNYFELRGTQERLRVARRNAENQEATLELTLALLHGGRGTDLDTSRARAQLTTTLATIPPLEAAVKHAIHRLGVLTG
jgi:multidrug efflux system outer membrane protein